MSALSIQDSWSDFIKLFFCHQMNYFGKIRWLIKKKSIESTTNFWNTKSLIHTCTKKKGQDIYLKIIYEEQKEKDVIIKIPSIKISNNQVNKRFFSETKGKKEKKSFLIDDQKVKKSNWNQFHVRNSFFWTD